jgi:hypothetical protein
MCMRVCMYSMCVVYGIKKNQVCNQSDDEYNYRVAKLAKYVFHIEPTYVRGSGLNPGGFRYCDGACLWSDEMKIS